MDEPLHQASVHRAGLQVPEGIKTAERSLRPGAPAGHAPRPDVGANLPGNGAGAGTGRGAGVDAVDG